MQEIVLLFIVIFATYNNIKLMKTTILFFHGYRQENDIRQSSKAYELLKNLISANSDDELCFNFVNWSNNDLEAVIALNTYTAKSSIRNNENIILIGHSTGGNIATMIQNKLKSENLFAKLILINPLIDVKNSTLPEELKNKLTADYSKVSDSEVILSLFDGVTNWQTANSALCMKNGISFESQPHQITNLHKHSIKNILTYIHKRL